MIDVAEKGCTLALANDEIVRRTPRKKTSINAATLVTIIDMVVELLLRAQSEQPLLLPE